MSFTSAFVKQTLPPPVLKRLKRIRRRIRDGYNPYVPQPFDNTYPWLNYAFMTLMEDSICGQKPQYVWGVLQGAALGRVLKKPRISVIEFGVAGGYGLLSLEAIGKAVETLVGIRIDVFGFDTGVGLTKPIDIRDQPNMWFEGQLPMDQTKLKAALTSARLVLGPVEETVPAFVASGPAPVAFVSQDLDLYSSTRDALGLFAADSGLLLPRVSTYFDDIYGHTYNEYCGERLAIREFNEQQSQRKLCQMHGVRYFMPPRVHRDLWPDGMFWCHVFDHPEYSILDSLNKAVIFEY